MVICQYCDQQATFKTSLEFYGKDYGGNLWVCIPCDARVGTKGRTKIPHGSLANNQLRQMRKNAHLMFDKYWKSGQFTRTDMYKKLQREMNLSEAEAHIGQFNEEQCKVLINKIANKVFES